MRRAEMAGAELSLAERKRLLVRDELGSAALKLLAAKGFEGTTIDEIAAAAGVSRRTFFRYFRSKEDVIIEFLGDVGEFMSVELAGRPKEESAAEAIKRVLGVAIDAFTEHPEKSRGLARLVMASPALKGRYLERQSESARNLGQVLAERSGLPPDDLRSQVTAVVALAAFDTALIHWIGTNDDDPASLRGLLAQALAAAGALG